MREELEFSYEPFPTNLEISETSYDKYLMQKGLPTIVEEIVVSPFEEELKTMSQQEFEKTKFPFSITRKTITKSNISWEKIYSDLIKFLQIRADDSRAKEMSELKKFEGIGYCIKLLTLEDEIKKIEKNNTSQSTYSQLYWPRMKKDEQPLREILIPPRDYRKITKENAIACLKAKKFIHSFEKEVIDVYKNVNKLWLKEATDYFWEKKEKIGKLPSREESPVQRTRKIARGKYIVIKLIRKEDPLYENIITDLKNDLAELRRGKIIEGYRFSQDKEWINITSVLNKIDLNRIRENQELTKKYIEVSGRYIIEP